MNVLKSIVSAVLPDRTLMHMRAADHWLNGEHELRLVSRLCAAGRDAVDAGANIGTYAYFLRKHATRVHAYEPNPGLAERLSRLMPDVNVRNVALSDAPRELVLQIPVDEHGNVRHEQASVAQKFAGQVKEFRVQGTTIDSEALANVGFIKIDVEQHERQVLRGALATIARCRPVMLVEVYPLKYQQSLADEFAFITGLNYVAWFSYHDAWYALSTLKPDVHTVAAQFGSANFMGNNLIFYPSEHPDALRGPLA
jgi:FkbM family methyltransferase